MQAFQIFAWVHDRSFTTSASSCLRLNTGGSPTIALSLVHEVERVGSAWRKAYLREGDDCQSEDCHPLYHYCSSCFLSRCRFNFHFLSRAVVLLTSFVSKKASCFQT